MTSIANLEMSDALDWCERNFGRPVQVDGEQGSLSGYTQRDGICWVTVELPDGLLYECPSDDVSLVDD